MSDPDSHSRTTKMRDKLPFHLQTTLSGGRMKPKVSFMVGRSQDHKVGSV